MINTERALTGWKEIAEFMGWSEKKARRKKAELQQSGCIFYSMLGRPPHKCVQAFPARLRIFTSKKNELNEIL